MRALTAARLLGRAFLRRDEVARHALAERVVHALYPRGGLADRGRTIETDEDIRAVFHRIEGPGPHRSLERKFTLDQLLKQALLAPGDTAECGVFRGTSSYLICRRIAGSGRTHHVFDSFEGLSAPGAGDGESWSAGDMAVDEESVRRTLSDFDCVSFHRGWIPERFADVAERRFAFVHVDVDLFQPTHDSLAFFWERLSPGGMILSDDYGFTTCPGAREAFDRFFAERPEPVVELSTGQAFVLRTKAD